MHMRGAGGHAPESLFHRQAKLRILNWVAQRYPSLDARAEEIAAAGARIADVMITSCSPPGRLAVEIQYSKLSFEEWRERHESYRGEDIHDVWLFGHASRHLRLADDSDYLVLGDPVRRMLAMGLPAFWINPIEGTVATARIDASKHRCTCGQSHAKPGEFWLQPSGIDHHIEVGIDPLDECRLRRGEFVTPTLLEIQADTHRWQERRDIEHQEADRLAEERRRVWAEKQRRRQIQQAALQRREQHRRQAVVLQAQKELAELRKWWADHRQALDQKWADSDLRAEVDQFPARARKVLAAELDSDLAVRATPEHWHTILYREHVWMRETGYRFTYKQCVRTLREAGVALHPNSSRVANAVQQFTAALEQVGCVAKRGRGLVVCFPYKRSSPAEAAEESGPTRPEHVVPSQPNERTWPRAAADTDHSADAESPTSVACARCGLTSFDPIVVRVGVHADPYCDR